MVLLKSLAARMESYGLQSHMRGYTDTQGAAPWLLSGTRGSCVVSSNITNWSINPLRKHFRAKWPQTEGNLLRIQLRFF